MSVRFRPRAVVASVLAAGVIFAAPPTARAEEGGPATPAATSTAVTPRDSVRVAVAAGNQPNLTFNPMDQAATITAYIVQVAKGDLPHGSTGYLTIFAAGLTLFVLTLMFNLLGYWLRKRYREEY